MKVGDLVKIIPSPSDRVLSPFAGEVGVIISEQLGRATEHDSFSVMLRDRIAVFNVKHLQVINEGSGKV